MLNSGVSRIKISKIEKVINIICIYLIIVLSIMCSIMSVLASVFTNSNANNMDSTKNVDSYIYYSGG